MKQDLKFFAVAMAAFVLGMGLNNFAMSGVPANYKVAVVDVQKVISQSSQVAALKKDQQAKMNNLINFVDTARKNIAKEKNCTDMYLTVNVENINAIKLYEKFGFKVKSIAYSMQI